MPIKPRHRRLDPKNYILLLLLREGSQSQEQIREHVARRTLTSVSRWGRRRLRSDDHFDVAAVCKTLADENLIKAIVGEKYELTPEGKKKAESIVQRIEKGADRVEKQILKPSAAARNITISYTILAVIKLVTGFLSGSVGLIADGADTTVDTAASSVVWAGIRFKREVLGTLVIIGLMFATAGLLIFNSAKSILAAFAGNFTPLTIPFVVIVVESVVAVSMFALSYYQRLVGRRSQSLPLISQSIDSQNSIYSSVAVIIGAIFSLMGVYWVDAVVGAIIAARITFAGVALSREAAKTMKGQQPDFSKYKLPFEEQIGERRIEGFHNWILYVVYKDKLKTKGELITSLEKTFQPSYLPSLYSELTAGRGVNFKKIFSSLVTPLIQQGYLSETNGIYTLTGKGKTYVKATLDMIKYRQTELS